MPKEIKNSESFDRLLDSMADGFGRAERLSANEAGADVFMKIMKPKVPKRAHLRNVHGHTEKIHLRDSLIKVAHPNGAVDIGFTAKGEKGYIGRFVNDGWQVRDRNGAEHSHVAGKNFWESTQTEAKGKVGQAIAQELKKSMDKKARGE